MLLDSSSCLINNEQINSLDLATRQAERIRPPQSLPAPPLAAAGIAGIAVPSSPRLDAYLPGMLGAVLQRLPPLSPFLFSVSLSHSCFPLFFFSLSSLSLPLPPHLLFHAFPLLPSSSSPFPPSPSLPLRPPSLRPVPISLSPSLLLLVFGCHCCLASHHFVLASKSSSRLKSREQGLPTLAY